jgi:RNA polymerase sigma-70 factor (family 1)
MPDKTMEEYTKLPDAVLVDLLKSGDPAAFTEIYDRYGRVLYVYAMNMVRDDAEAEDLVQEIFLSLWDHSERRDIKGTLSSYLYSAVRYKFLNLVSRRKVRSDYAESFQKVLDTGVQSTDDYINEKQLMSLIEQEVARLPDKMREVFELSRNAGLTHQQIAEELNISEKTVKSHIHHALKIFRSQFSAAAILLFLFPH